ncbi:MAG: chemotaxis protein CheA [Azospirillaceae bacterium]|nr:chemotaxis protein CheA [Azospirillaceae bacterium]
MNSPLLDRFVGEARDLVQGAAAALLALERQPGDEASINAVFRSVHTLKGSVGLFDFPAFTKLVHAGEDLLSAVRAGQVTLTPERVDRLLEAFDQVGRWIDEIDAGGALLDGAVGISRDLTMALRAMLPAQADPAGARAANPTADTAAATLTALDWLGGLPEADRLAALAAASNGREILAVEYVPATDCFFSGEDPLTLFRPLSSLCALVIDSTAAWPQSDALDPYQCILRFRIVTAAPRSEIESLFRYVIEQIKIAVITPNQLRAAVTAGSPGAGALPIASPVAAPSAMVIRIIEGQRTLLATARTATDRMDRLASVARIVSNLLTVADREADLTSWSDAMALARRDETGHPVVAWFDRWLESQATTASQTPAETPPSQGGPRPRIETADPEGRPDNRVSANRILKVDQAKVDSLMNLIGELVVSKNSLPFLAKRADEVHGSREMSREIKDVYAVIDRLAQEMQGAIMAIRMLPVSEVFERFPRLVRDVSRKLGKHIALVIEGEDTAADKNIIEVLGDPLLHIIRNAIDHGIEKPEDRAATGKAPEATVRVKAFQDGDQVVIDVSDDGRGIDPEKIKASALAKGIIDADRAARLSDQEAVNLVFYPGFSTAETVSDLSGRGVGMDVVVTTIERAGGTVAVTSRRGQGTTVRLSLPLSMAVTRVMTVEAGGGMLFGIPMDHIAETVRVRRDAVQRIKTSEVFVLRDSVVPLVRLDNLLGIDAPIWFGNGDDEEAVLVVHVGGNLIGLVVDHFREGMDIILKPLNGILAGVRGYIGTALLGDGRVLLVLNLKELF